MTSRASRIVIAVALLACRDPVGPMLPAGARALEHPPLAYERWWGDTESCSGVVGDFNAVRWFVVPETESFELGGVQYDAFWSARDNWIILAERVANEPLVVRHEILHALLRRADHPSEYFRQKCAGIVACRTDCSG